MSDKFFTLPVERLFRSILEQEKNGSIFGIPNSLFFTPNLDDSFRMERYGHVLETPIGVASGPHTQMAQNIIAAWLTGARYIELKTVQTLDELHVSKPCIDMENEGYNVEWSQELKLDQSYHQYLDAWIIIHLLRDKWKHAGPEPGMLFNLSAGYNMEGILKDNVQRFLNKMGNCGSDKRAKLTKIAQFYPDALKVEIPDCISNSMTLSTMHGCPPNEIEKIGKYLIQSRGYHTTIKLNPTLLGPQRLREILNDTLGFDITVPDDAFAHDLKYDDALNLIASLTACAAEKGVHFGLKLTNTLECLNHRDAFSKDEKMQYMSGKPLHPISVNVAALLQKAFKGSLDISFSAGVDCFNVAEVVACGIQPVTVCSDVLKPGGYGRLFQFVENLRLAVLPAAKGSFEKPPLDPVKRLEMYADEVLGDVRYRKEWCPGKGMKNDRPLPLLDCIAAPCQWACPTHQDVPRYMMHAAAGDVDKALAVILETNPFPATTGLVCDHVCTDACTRMNLDNALHIRDIKRFITEHAMHEPSLSPLPKTGLKVAVIGAGPSGLSCAFFLALNGLQVEVFEAKDQTGGMVSATIPGFRLTDEDVKKDVQRIIDLGVTIHLNHSVDKQEFIRLRENFDFVYVAVGAQKASRLNIEGQHLEGVTDALSFLAQIRKQGPNAVSPGKRIAIVGGGNSACDAARTAWRMNKDQDCDVVMLYRRTKAQMPADGDEIKALLEEGIKIMELTNPVKIEKSTAGLDVTCCKMKLSNPDDSGRPRPLKIEGSEFTMQFDTIIAAIGQQVVFDFLDQPLYADSVTLQFTGGPSVKNVYIGGDALHGPFNIITAVADGRKAASSIMDALDVYSYRPVAGKALAVQQKEAATRCYGSAPAQLDPSLRRNFNKVGSGYSEAEARAEASRCLQCGDICNVCVTVCPNRANVGYIVEPKTYQFSIPATVSEKAVINKVSEFKVSQPYQVFNIADFCNECGNCNTFCPSAGAPYRDKPKICLSEACFAVEPNAYYVASQDQTQVIQWKTTTGENIRKERLTLEGDLYHYETPELAITLDRKDFTLRDVRLKKEETVTADLSSAVRMRLLLTAVLDLRM